MKKHADTGRNNDNGRLKTHLSTLVNHGTGAILVNTSKANLGFKDDVTGLLLCPISHDWDDEE